MCISFGASDSRSLRSLQPRSAGRIHLQALSRMLVASALTEPGTQDSSHLDLPVGQLTAWELASLKQESQCPCSLISEMTPHCFHLLYLSEARCKDQPTLRRGDTTKRASSPEEAASSPQPWELHFLTQSWKTVVWDADVQLFRDHLWAPRLGPGRQCGSRADNGDPRRSFPAAGSFLLLIYATPFNRAGRCVAGRELGSVGYLNEHFKRSLHHLFSLLITNSTHLQLHH